MHYYIIEFINKDGEERKWRVPDGISLSEGINKVFEQPTSKITQIQDVTEGKKLKKVIYL